MLAVFSRAGWPVERHFESGVIDLDFPLDRDRGVPRLRGAARAARRLPGDGAAAAAPIDRRGRCHRPPGLRRRGAVASRHDERDRTGLRRQPAPRTVGGQRSWPSVRVDPRPTFAGRDRRPRRCLASVIEDCIAVAGARGDRHHRRRRAPRSTCRRWSTGPAATACGSSGPAAWAWPRPRASIGLQASLVPVGPAAAAPSPSRCSRARSAPRSCAWPTSSAIGMSWFVSLGDKGDVSGNDLLQFWEDDETTTVIAMYTETFGNPRKFARIARRVSRQRPIVAVRTGAAAVGPTGGALYQQAGLIEVPTVAALLDTARVLATQPVLQRPARRRAHQRPQPRRAGRERADDGRARAGRAAARRSTGDRRRDDYGAARPRRARRPRGRRRHRRPRSAARRGHRPARSTRSTTAVAGAAKPIVAVAHGRPQRPAAPGLGGPGVHLPRAGRRRPRPGRGPTAAGCRQRRSPHRDVADIDRPRAADVIAAALASDDSGDDGASPRSASPRRPRCSGAYGIAVPPSRRAPVAAAVDGCRRRSATRSP